MDSDVQTYGSFHRDDEGYVSIGIQSGPPIGVQKGPPWDMGSWPDAA